MKQILITMSILSMLFGTSNQTDKIQVLNPAEFKAGIEDSNVQLIDVRTSNEFKSGFIKNAKNIDFYATNFLNQFEKFDKQKPLFLYCRSGMRSSKAAKKLVAIGFNEVYDLKGGYLNWK